MIQHNETTQSIVSYSSAGGASAVALSLESMAGPAQNLTIILACAVVAVRLAYDTTRFIKYLLGDNNDDSDGS